MSPNLLLKAIKALDGNLKWQWLSKIKQCLHNCDLHNMYVNNIYQTGWLKDFKIKNKCNDTKSWLERAKLKKSLTNYRQYKGEPKFEKYLLDKTNFKGISQKFKARTNGMDLEARKESWHVNNRGLCHICEGNHKETVDHFL